MTDKLNFSQDLSAAMVTSLLNQLTDNCSLCTLEEENNWLDENGGAESFDFEVNSIQDINDGAWSRDKHPGEEKRNDRNAILNSALCNSQERGFPKVVFCGGNDQYKVLTFSRMNIDLAPDNCDKDEWGLDKSCSLRLLTQFSLEDQAKKKPSPQRFDRPSAIGRRRNARFTLRRRLEKIYDRERMIRALDSRVRTWKTSNGTESEEDFQCN